jgi:hypothetical protein
MRFAVFSLTWGSGFAKDNIEFLANAILNGANKSPS